MLVQREEDFRLLEEVTTVPIQVGYMNSEYSLSSLNSKVVETEKKSTTAAAPAPASVTATVVADIREIPILQPTKFLGNQVSTAKYNPFSFLPKFLYVEFSKSANLFFLFISGIQVHSCLFILYAFCLG